MSIDFDPIPPLEEYRLDDYLVTEPISGNKLTITDPYEKMTRDFDVVTNNAAQCAKALLEFARWYFQDPQNDPVGRYDEFGCVDFGDLLFLIFRGDGNQFFYFERMDLKTLLDSLNDLNLHNANFMLWCEGPDDEPQPSRETFDTIIDKVADYLVPDGGFYQWTTYSKNPDITKMVYSVFLKGLKKDNH